MICLICFGLVGDVVGFDGRDLLEFMIYDGRFVYSHGYHHANQLQSSYFVQDEVPTIDIRP